MLTSFECLETFALMFLLEFLLLVSAFFQIGHNFVMKGIDSVLLSFLHDLEELCD